MVHFLSRERGRLSVHRPYFSTYEQLYSKNKIASTVLFRNTICTVEIPMVKNKNTFQKEPNGESTALTHTTQERQQMSALQGNNVFVAKNPDVPSTAKTPSRNENVTKKKKRKRKKKIRIVFK